MTSSEKAASQANVHTKPVVSPELLLSLATAPMLIALVGGKALAVAVRELGLLSEELFRGDRLPVLKVPRVAKADPDDSTDV